MPNSTKFLLSQEGKKRLEQELVELQKLKAFKTRGESPRIFHSEDINPEFLAFQEDLDLLDARILELEQVLKNTQPLVSPPKEKQNQVLPGALVTVEINGQQNQLKIVGSLEANPALGQISNECSVGRALLGRKVGDVVQLDSDPRVVYKIKKIKY